MSKIICVVSQKGGVGKTITAVNLAASLAMLSRKTVLIDCDPQGSATIISGIFDKKIKYTLEEGLYGTAGISDILVKTCLSGMHVIPAPFNYFMNSSKIATHPDKENLLKKLIENLDNDYIIIDTPASVSILTLNAIIASHTVLIPLQSEYLSFQNLYYTLRYLSAIKKEHHPTLKLEGILLTMHSSDQKISASILESAKRHLKNRLFKTIIPRDDGLKESPALEKPLTVNDVNSAGSRSYFQLAREILKRETVSEKI